MAEERKLVWAVSRTATAVGLVWKRAMDYACAVSRNPFPLHR